MGQIDIHIENEQRIIKFLSGEIVRLNERRDKVEEQLAAAMQELRHLEREKSLHEKL